MAGPAMRFFAPVRRHYVWVPMILLGLAALLTLDLRLHINGDNVSYMRLAESIRNGEGIWPASRFPPGFPWLLVPIQSIWGLNLLPQKILVFTAYLVAVFFGTHLTFRFWGPWRGGLAALLGMSLIPVVEYSHYVMSEIPFLAVVMACFWWVDRRDGEAAHSFREGFIAGALAMAAFWIRSAGLVIPAAVLGAYGLQRRRKAAMGAALAIILLILPWIVKTAMGGAGQSYIRQFFLVNPYFPEFGFLGFPDLLDRLLHNGKEYFLLEIPHLVWPAIFRSTYTNVAELSRYLPIPAVGAAWLLILIGLVQGARRLQAWVLASLLTLVLCLLWPPIWGSSRFLVPIAPFLMWAFLNGAWIFFRWILGPRGRWFFRVVVLALLILAGQNLVKLKIQSRTYPPAWDAYFQAARWVRMNMPEGILIIDRKPGLFGFVSERRCEGFPREADSQKMLQNFEERDVDLVVLSRIPYDDIGRFLLPAISRHPNRFELVYSDRGIPEREVFLFHLLSPAETPDSLGIQ